MIPAKGLIAVQQAPEAAMAAAIFAVIALVAILLSR
jgi:hypothetical protein